MTSSYYLKSNLTGKIGALVLLASALYAVYRWYQTEHLYFILLIIRDFTGAILLLKRNDSVTSISSRKHIIYSYVSCFVPAIYLSPSFHSNHLLLVSNIIAIIGFTISTIALIDLGKSFGVAPSNRGIVKTGIYKYFKHPMYAGYSINEFGIVLLNPMNGIIFTVSCLLYLYRAKTEDKYLSQKEI